MINWLIDMTHPDGKISFFNDAAFGIAPNTEALIAYAEEAGNWNEENLDAWLKKPKDLVRKTKMIFPGLKKEADRADLIAYLKENGNN